MSSPLKLSFLYGLRADQWREVLRENGYAVHPRAWHYAALISLFSLQNSWLSRGDDRLALDPPAGHPPIFILGHWRSGTTHLHYLLASDPRFGAPSTYDCAYPWSFLTSAEAHGRSLEPFAPDRRPQDDMDFGLWTPQEDELALTVLCLKSPYMAWAFPEREAHYMRYLTFEDAEPGARGAFIEALRRFEAKLRHRHRGPIVFKSPGHTARIPMLLEAFPDARFVHIVRDPYRVYQSSLHLYATWQQAFAFLQPPDPSTVPERVLGMFERMYRAFFAHEDQLPEGRSCAVRMEDLERDPMGELEAIYAGAALGEPPREALRAYLEGVADYKQNRYPPLTPEVKAQVAERWGFVFERYGYAT